MPPFTAPRRIALTAAALTATILSAANAAQASTQVEALGASTAVAGYNGTAMWSRLDAATGKYQLVQSLDGAEATPVAVPQRDGAFDVDLGSNRSGATSAVYTRGGDIYRLDLATAVEQRLAQLSSPGQVERNPTIQGGRIAFLRRAGGRDQLRIGEMTASSKGTRLLLKSKAIHSIELGAKQISYVDNTTGTSTSGKGARVHVRNIATGRDQVVFTENWGGASFFAITKPSFAPSGFVWALSRLGKNGSRIVKYTLRTGKLSYDKGSPRYASVAWVSDELGAIASTSDDATVGSSEACNNTRGPSCTIQSTGPLSFALLKP